MVGRLLPTRVTASVATRRRLPTARDTRQQRELDAIRICRHNDLPMGDKLTLDRASEPQAAGM